MCSLFRNKFRNESIRLNSHDYSSGGKYFITICTHMGLSYFGNISNGKMILSESGQIAHKLWYELPEHFASVSLEEFVVMPNHIHGIIIIESTNTVGTLHADDALQSPVRTLHATSLLISMNPIKQFVYLYVIQSNPVFSEINCLRIFNH